MSIIKVGYLISYDYEYVKTSLPRVYDHVTEIVFAVDSNGKTWSGEDIKISNEFWNWVDEYDKDHKISIYRDQFYVAGLTPMECDTRERNLLGKKMGEADWYIQIDSDEYFVDFATFKDKLAVSKPEVPTSIYCSVATLFKRLSTGFLLIDESFETLSFATNHPVYDLARNNTSGNLHIYWDDLVLHQSWARSSEEIGLKLNNWSHKNDFNTESFYKLWNAIDEYNYYCLADFHPLNPKTWPRLRLMKGTIAEILDDPELSRFRAKAIAGRKKNIFSRTWKTIKSNIAR